MTNEKKPRRVWAYLDDDAQTRLANVIKNIRSLDEVTVLSTMLAAALKACEEQGNRLPLPLNFKIVAPTIEAEAEAGKIFQDAAEFVVGKERAASRPRSPKSRRRNPSQSVTKSVREPKGE